MKKSQIAAVILAAGRSSRMGTLKPLLDLGEETVLKHTVRLFQTAGIKHIRVVVGHRAEEILSKYVNLPVNWIYNDGFDSGMLSSIQQGVENLAENFSAFFILPVDIPLVRVQTISKLLRHHRMQMPKSLVVYPTFRNKRGHPPLISTRLIPDILQWKQSGGLKTILKCFENQSCNVQVIDEYILLDMDTDQDYQSLLDRVDRYDIPNQNECEAMLEDQTFFTRETAAHCRKVADVAKRIAAKVYRSENSLQKARIHSSALLHDVARDQPDHANAGAELLKKLGFCGVSEIVKSHMDIHDYNNNSRPDFLTEQEIVYIADKLVKGDKIVDLSIRFNKKLALYGDNPHARSAILYRKKLAQNIVKRLEKITEDSIQKILTEQL